MNHGSGLARDGLAEAPGPHDWLASSHAPGLADELGDRLLILDDRNVPSMELLRFRRTLSAIAGFEVALRRRAERLSQFRHPTFATVRGVEYVAGHGLVLLSNYTPGRRLSELLPDAPRDPVFAASLIRQLTPALATLHDLGDGMGHGALSASRIVVTPEGRLVIVEHVLGSALERLRLTATRLYTDLGIAMPPIGASARLRLDSRRDYFQLGLIALSLLLGRPLSSDEFREDFTRALDQVATSDSPSAAPVRGLRMWLERALELNGQVFDSSRDAQDALAELPDAGADHIARQWRGLLELAPPAGNAVGSYAHEGTSPDNVGLEIQAGGSAAGEEAGIVPPTPTPEAAEPSASPPSSTGSGAGDSEVQVIDLPLTIPSSAQTISETASSGSVADRTLSAGQNSAPISAFTFGGLTGWTHWTHWSVSRPKGRMRALVVALTLCAIAEGFVIASLLQRRWAAATPAGIAEVNIETQDPGASVLVDGRPVGVTPFQLKIGAETRSISVGRPSRQPVGSTGLQNLPPDRGRDLPAEAAGRTGGAHTAAAPAPQRSGGIRFVSPIELEVFEGDRRLGSSATGIVSARAGRHDLELVNSVLGFRSRQSVEVRGGQVVSVAVSPPNGRVNINAAPWAEVWVDGRPMGETPIGNLSLPLGEHEVVFRHPQFGEQRKTVVVRLDGVTRVSASFPR